MKQKYYIHVIVCGLAALVLTACIDEMHTEQAHYDGQAIKFSAQVKNGWDESTGTRSDASASYIGESVQMKGGSQSFYVRTEVTDGINMRRATASNAVETGTGGIAGKDTAITRGVVVTASNFYNSFGVLGYSFVGNWDGTQTPNLMYDTKATLNNAAYKTNVSWPDVSENVRFYAYAPHSEDATGITLSLANTTGAPKLSYEVPTDVDQQSDLLGSISVETETAPHTSPQSIEFHHLLTAVCFKIGDDMTTGTINEIKLKNIKYKGTYTFPTYTPWISNRGQWDVNDDDVKDFTLTPEFATDGTANVQINTGDQVLMMLPQTLSNDAEVEIKFTDTGNNISTYRAKLKGLALWQQGQTVTYTISTAEDASVYVLTVEPGDLTISYGGINSFTGIYITSYLQKSDNTQEAVPWYAEYYDEGSSTWKSTNDLPDYAAFWRTSSDAIYGYNGSPGFGGSAAERRRWAMDPQEPRQGVSYHSEQLKARAVKGSEGNPVDLSTHPLNATTGLLEDTTSPMSTANCYVIPQPGYYKIPIVYGNAIKNGAANIQAYAPTGVTAGEYNMTMQHTWEGTRKAAVLTPFVNHKDEAITDPWIKNNSGCTVSDAVLVWQDEDGLVTPASVAVDGDYIKFTVPKETIHQGNAIIAVRDASQTIMWSWHIWVTDENIMDTYTIKNYEGDTYGLMKVNLGWCSNEGLIFDARSFRIRIRQNPATARTAYFTVTQTGGFIPDDNTRGTCPYYQWGRKDPVLPSDGIVEFGTAPDKTIYSYNGYTPSCTATIGDNDYWTIGESIQRPQYKYQKTWYAMWQVTPVMNLWNANCDVLMVNSFLSPIPDEPDVTKTIYDPCPVGFSVPQLHTFTGLTSTGRSRTNRDDMANVSRTNEWNGSTTGFYFYCDPSNKSDDDVWFFPCCGYRTHGSGDAIRTGMFGGFWTATMTNLDNHATYVSEGACAGIDVTGSGYFCIGYMVGYSSTAIGWSIRPMKE